MKKGWNKYKWIIIISAFLIFIVPILIHYLFKTPALCDFFIPEWSAGDILSFYGTIVASIATIVGVYWSIKYAQQNYHEDEINRVRPYLALSHYRAKSRHNLFLLPDINQQDDNENQRNGYEEYRLDKLYIIVYPNRIEYKDGLTREQHQILETGGINWVKNQRGQFMTQIDYMSLPCEVESIGNGPVTNLRVSFYKSESSPRFANMFTLQTGKSIYIHIFSEKFSESIYGDYILEFVYNDLYGNCYSQKFNVKLCWNSELKRHFSATDLIGIQEKLEMEESDNGQDDHANP